MILMSMRMPLLGGVEATRRIREINNACIVPIVAMSTYPTRKAQVSALAVGCAAFVPQPIDFDVLDRVLRSLLPESIHEGSTEMGHMSFKDTSLIKRQRVVSA